MIESQAETAAGTWSVAECPFEIEYSLRALDDIRLTVMDAFFSLPRGGAEIGGVLLGEHTQGRVTIHHYLPLDCEHAFGPSFTLSPRDEAKLAELLAQPGAWRPVGWYHSHTRSEIFLTDADQTIHARFFPEPWQIALVLKPHTFQPMRAGFFFRQADGTMHCTATLREFTIEAQPVRPIPVEMPGPTDPRRTPDRETPRDTAGVIDIVAATEPPAPVNGGHGAVSVGPAVIEPAKPADEEKLQPELDLGEPQPQPERNGGADPKPEAQEPLVEPPPPVAETGGAAPTTEPAPAPAPAADLGLPKFLQEPQKRSTKWLKTVGAVAAGLALGAGAYQARDSWYPRVAALLTSAPSAPAAEIGLTTSDSAGQLQIHWDPAAPAVRRGLGAMLQISDGAALPKNIRLDRAHLLAGNFTYSRDSEEVDVSLTIDEAGSPPAKDVTGFVGRLPAKTPPQQPAVEDTALRGERDALAAENTQLKSDLAAQTERSERLQKALIRVENELKQQQRKRLGAQNPDH